MYFPRLDATSGRLIDLKLVPPDRNPWVLKLRGPEYIGAGSQFGGRNAAAAALGFADAPELENSVLAFCRNNRSPALQDAQGRRVLRT
jgi:hypothetical protein